MYYALKDLKIGRGEMVAAGQPIPSASSWSHAVLRAHLNLGWIEERPDSPEAKKAPAVVEEPQEKPKQKRKKSSSDPRK